MPIHHQHISKILQNNEIFHPVDKPEFFDTGTPTFSKWTQSATANQRNCILLENK